MSAENLESKPVSSSRPLKAPHEPLRPKTALTPKDIYEKMLAELGDKIVLKFFVPEAESKDPKKKLGGESYVIVASEEIIKVCTFLRKDPALSFDSLMCLGGLDEAAAEGKEAAYTIVYELYSFKHRHRIGLHARLSKTAPSIKTVEKIWHAADWFERETFDLFGVNFENHPDLRRLMLPPDWEGHPLRKDYEYPKEYNGISCVRPKLK